MKITIYTIKDCEFSKQEKDYFALKGITYDERDIESNREWLTEMLAVSNNFAGTPVTKIEKDDGQISVLKGFTQSEFDAILSPMANAHEEVKADSQTPPTPPTPEEPPAPTPPPVPEPKPPIVDTPPTPPIETMPTQPVAVASTTLPPLNTHDPLSSIMTDLQEKSQNATMPASPAPVASEATPTTAAPAPTSVPDFPQT